MTEYRCFCKSKKGRAMTWYDNDPRRYSASKAPFGRSEYGFWCKSCKKIGLKKEENNVLVDGRWMNRPKILIDILSEEVVE